MTEKAEGVLLRYNTERREWEQLVDPTPLKSQDRMLGLDPFRSTLSVGQAKGSIRTLGLTEYQSTPERVEVKHPVLWLERGRVDELLPIACLVLYRSSTPSAFSDIPMMPGEGRV